VAYDTHETTSGLLILIDPQSEGNFEVVKLDVGESGESAGPVSEARPMPVMAPDALPVDFDGQMEVVLPAAGAAIHSSDCVWANSAAANTAVTKDIDLSSVVLSPGGGLLIVVKNPSGFTALNGKVQVGVNYGSGTEYADFATFDIDDDNGGGQAIPVDPLLTASLRVSLSNATGLGSTQGFTAKLRVFAR